MPGPRPGCSGIEVSPAATAPAAGVDAVLPLLVEYLVAASLDGGYKHLDTG